MTAAFLPNFKKAIDKPFPEWYNNLTSVSGLFLLRFVCAKFGRAHGHSGGRYTDSCNPGVKYFKMGGAAIMANDVRVKVTLVCTECKQRNYDTKKNKKNDPDRLEFKKYCRFCRKHTLHKESK